MRAYYRPAYSLTPFLGIEYLVNHIHGGSAVEDKKKRSRSYPGYSLEECIRWARLLRAEMGSGPHDRNSIARALGSTGLTGASTRKIGAMVHFGLLNRDSDGYSLSNLSERILRPVEETERRKGLIEAVTHPDLYAELFQRFDNDKRLPSRLANILVRDHGIEDSAAEDATRIFVASGRFAGLLDEEGRIVSLVSTQRHQIPALGSDTASAGSDITERPVSDSTIAEHVAGELQQFRFALTRDRIAYLTVPFELSAHDILLIRKQVELLSLQVELAESLRR